MLEIAAVAFPIVFIAVIVYALVSFGAYMDGVDQDEKTRESRTYFSSPVNRHSRLTSWAFTLGYKSYDRKADHLARNIMRNSA